MEDLTFGYYYNQNALPQFSPQEYAYMTPGKNSRQVLVEPISNKHYTAVMQDVMTVISQVLKSHIGDIELHTVMGVFYPYYQEAGFDYDVTIPLIARESIERSVRMYAGTTRPDLIMRYGKTFIGCVSSRLNKVYPSFEYKSNAKVEILKGSKVIIFPRKRSVS